MEEVPLEFELHNACHKSDSKLQPKEPVLLACKQLEDLLVQNRLVHAVEELLGVCRSQYANGIERQIFPVQIHKNQEEELRQFLFLLEDELNRKRNEIFAREGRMKEESKEEVKVVFLDGTEVRDLVLHMYIYLEEHPAFEVVVFIANEVTDLCEKNLYCFEKAFKGKRFISVMGTFAPFENEMESSHHYEKYHMTLYDPKELFCQFVYECVASPKIKAYLPEEVLSLISDMDYYFLSFRESCRRFSYCLERALMLVHRERTWVDFEALIALIQDTITKRFKLYCGYKNSLQRILKVILSQKQGYTISEKAVSLQMVMSGQYGPALDEDNFMNTIRDSLFKHLGLRSHFQEYTKYLTENEDQPQVAIKKKKSRSDQLGIDTRKNMTQKNKLEDQITKIIKQATHSIREQAADIRWQDLKYDLRIRPEIPFLVVQALRNSDEAELVQELRSEYISPVVKLFAKYESERECGKLLYQMKEIETLGLIELTKKQQKPSACNLYFEKACFGGKH